jgi:hypothetical protein
MYKQSKGQIIEFCRPKEKKRFAWDDLYNDHLLEVDILYNNSANSKLSTVILKIDEMEQNERIRYKTTDCEGTTENHAVYYSTYTDKYTKKLVFDDKWREIQNKKSEDQTPPLMLNFKLCGIGISLINNARDKTLDIKKEILFVSITDIQGIWIESEHERIMQLRLGGIQIDNQVKLYTPFPITLYNANANVNNGKEETKPFFNLNLAMSKNIPGVMYFEKISFLIQQMILNWDEELILNLLYFGEEIMKKINTTFIGMNEIFLDSHEEKIDTKSMSTKDQNKIIKGRITRIPDWATEKVLISEQKIYIKSYKISPLSLIISFYSTSKIKQIKSFENVFKSFGVFFVFNSIEDAPIEINALELKDVRGTSNDVIYILRMRYIAMLRSKLFQILGASSLIGNPIKFTKDILTGVKDFYYKPIEGFVEGPLEGIKGLIKGSESLIEHTIHGLAGGTSRFFGSLSKGILVLANDNDHMREREESDLRERPTNLFEGIWYGTKSAVKSFRSGIIGVFKMPINEAKINGFVGLLSGSAKGAIGLVTKTISGIFDFVSKILEGIKNQTLRKEKGEIERVRFPRVFCTKERFFKEFSEFHTFCIMYLTKHQNILKSNKFVEALTVQKDPLQIIVIRESKVWMIDVAGDRVTLSVSIKWAKRIKDAPQMVILGINDSNFRIMNVKVDFESKLVLDRVFDLLEKMFK